MDNINFRRINLQVIRKITACLAIAEKHFKRHFTPPTISYDLRGIKAGVAYLQQNHIKLNRTLLFENQASFIAQTVPHELAHLIVYHVFGKAKPHGKEWQFVMQQLFQLPAQICHQFDITRVQGKTVAYQCPCQTHQLSLRRHHNIVKKSAVYFCRKCRGALKRVEE